MDCSPPGFSVHGILQARIVEWVTMSSSRDLSHSGTEPMSLVSPALRADSLPTGKPGNASDMQNHFQRLPKTEDVKTVYHILYAD